MRHGRRPAAASGALGLGCGRPEAVAVAVVVSGQAVSSCLVTNQRHNTGL